MSCLNMFQKDLSLLDPAPPTSMQLDLFNAMKALQKDSSSKPLIILKSF